MMSAETPGAVAALNERFLLDFPHEAAREIEAMPAADAAVVLAAAAPRAVVRAWQALTPDVAREVLECLPAKLAAHLLGEAEPAAATAVLAQLETEARSRLLAGLEPQVARELPSFSPIPRLGGAPDGSARQPAARRDQRRRGARPAAGAQRRGLRELFVVDDEGRLAGRVEIQDLATAGETESLRSITRALVAAVARPRPARGRGRSAHAAPDQRASGGERRRALRRRDPAARAGRRARERDQRRHPDDGRREP